MHRTGWVLVVVALLSAALSVPAGASTAAVPLRDTNSVLSSSSTVNAVFDGTRGRRPLPHRASVGRAALHGGWNATSYYTGSTNQSVEPGSTLTLEFSDERVSGNGGCTTFDGDYDLRRVDRIRIGPLTAMRRACADAAVDGQDSHYLAALELAIRYRVTGSSLTLYRPGGTLAATFQRATGLTSGS